MGGGRRRKPVRTRMHRIVFNRRIARCPIEKEETAHRCDERCDQDSDACLGIKVRDRFAWEGQAGDEQRHRESDAGQQANGDDHGPGNALWKARELSLIHI